MPRYRNTNSTTECENVSLYYMQFNRGNIWVAQIIRYPKYISRAHWWLYGKAVNFSLYLSTAPQMFRQSFLLYFIILNKKCLQKSAKVKHHSENLQNIFKIIIDSLIQKEWPFLFCSCGNKVSIFNLGWQQPHAVKQVSSSGLPCARSMEALESVQQRPLRWWMGWNISPMRKSHKRWACCQRLKCYG